MMNKIKDIIEDIIIFISDLSEMDAFIIILFFILELIFIISAFGLIYMLVIAH